MTALVLAALLILQDGPQRVECVQQIEVTVESAPAVESVSLYIQPSTGPAANRVDQLLQTWFQSPYKMVWDSVTFPNRFYVLSAIARFDDGTRATGTLEIEVRNSNARSEQRQCLEDRSTLSDGNRSRGALCRLGRHGSDRPE